MPSSTLLAPSSPFRWECLRPTAWFFRRRCRKSKMPSPFWERQPEMADMSFLFTEDPQFPTWWTTNPLPYPILTGWAAGNHAVALGGQSNDAIVRSAVQALARILGVDDREIHRQMIGAYAHDWQSDPFSRGAYSYTVVGGIDAARALATPVAETLYFAGEATNSDGYNGTVHGAIATGYRAAQEMLQAMGAKPQRTA